MGIAYQADGRKTLLPNGNTHYADNPQAGAVYRKWLDTFESWKAMVAAHVERPEPEPPYPFDTTIGKTGYGWIASRGD